MPDGGRKVLGNVEKKKIENWQEEEPYLYWMTCVEGIGSRTIEKLIGYAGSPRKAYDLKLPDMLEVIPKSRAEALIRAKKEGDIFEAKRHSLYFHISSMLSPTVKKYTGCTLWDLCGRKAA